MTTAPGTTDVELLIGGTTCVSCPAPAGKKLNNRDGFTASGHYSTAKAEVSGAGVVSTADPIATSV